MRKNDGLQFQKAYESFMSKGEINKELKVLRKLHKLLVIKNLKQVDIHYFQVE